MLSYVMLKKHLLKIILSISVLLYSILTFPFINRIYPNVYVSGIYLGNMTQKEAVNALERKISLEDKMTLTTDNLKSEVSISEIITQIKFSETVDRAYNYTNTGNYINDFLIKLNLIFNPVNLSPLIEFDDNKLLETLLIFSSSLETKTIYPSVEKSLGSIIVNPGVNGIEVDKKEAIKEIKHHLLYLDKNEIQINLKETDVELNEDEAKKYKLMAADLIGKKIELNSESEKIIIDDTELISFLLPTGFSDELIIKKILEISRKINRNPQNSVFTIENGKVTEFTPSKDGIIVNETLLLNKIKEIPEAIDIPVIKTSPEISNRDSNDLGINTRIGIGNSNFRGSIPNRIYNINLAQSKFKGLLIPPNKIVSFNEVLGDVSGLTGYKAAYVIKEGRTVLGDGGGVCQVSTTLFRAILNAGLPIVERRAHAYRVGYYEQGFEPGLDSTVYSPTTDFKFKNDTPAYILIQPYIDTNSLALTFEIYGTNDGRIATISKPIVTSSITPATDLYIDDPTLKSGAIKQIEHKAYGAKVVFDYKVMRDNEELINQKFVSNYQPWRAVYLRGTAQ